MPRRPREERSHTASFHWTENSAPSNAGTKQIEETVLMDGLVHRRGWLPYDHDRLLWLIG